MFSLGLMVVFTWLFGLLSLVFWFFLDLIEEKASVEFSRSTLKATAAIFYQNKPMYS